MSRHALGAGASRHAIRDTIVNIGFSRIFLVDGRENPADGRENPTFTMVVGPESHCFLMGAVALKPYEPLWRNCSCNQTFSCKTNNNTFFENSRSKPGTKLTKLN